MVNFLILKTLILIIGHKHESAPGSYKETYSQDEPHILKHTVKKPIYQEVNQSYIVKNIIYTNINVF